MAAEAADCTRPTPSQVGQVSCDPSKSDCFTRWRESSNRPNLGEILPTSKRALSSFIASFSASSTLWRFFASLMSMKSHTTRPPRSRRRSCRAISTAASRLDWREVFSGLPDWFAFPELTSIATRASVGSMTMEPPEGSGTWRL